MLGQRADREVVDDLGGALVDDIDGVGLRVGDVDARRVVADLRREPPGTPGRIDVVEVQQRRDLPGAGRRRSGRPRGVAVRRGRV